MRSLLVFLAVALMLVSCADESNSSSSEPELTTTTTTAPVVLSEPVTTTTLIDKQVPKTETISIEVDVDDYRDGKLYFTFEGKEYEREIDRETLNNKNTEFQFLSPCEPTMAERIIHNKYGKKIKGNLRVTEDMSKVIKCDVYSPNGRAYHGYIPDASDGLTPDPDYYYSFKRLGGSKAQLINKTEIIDIDLNELDMLRKIQFKNEFPYVIFNMYKFKDGDFILHSVSEAYVRDKFIMSEVQTDIRENQICYFGTVQKNENDTAEILLNDGKTVIVIPSYYHDGNIAVGTEVMAVLDTKEEKLFGTGKREIFDNALIYTEQRRFNKTEQSFEDLSYARVISLLDESFEYYTK